MRLIVSVDSLTPSLTGIGRYTWELVTRLQATSGLRQLRFYRSGSWIEDPRCLREVSPSSLSTKTGQTMSAQNYSVGKRRLSPAYRWAKKLYWQTTCRGNVFHAPNYFLPSYARNGVITVHDLSVLKFPETHPVERVCHWDSSFRHSLDLAVQLITDTESTRQEVISQFQWPAERVTSVPLGVSAAYRPRAAAETQHVLATHELTPDGYALCVATLEPRKRIGALLSAYRLLPKSLRNAYPLVLVGGKGWQADRLIQQVADAQAEGWLNYLGFVPGDALPMLYAGARGFIYPSIYEGFGLPVAEAMASGVPVVTSNRSSLPEVAGGAAWLIDPEITSSLAVAIEEMLTDTDKRSEAVATGLRVVASYSWDECMQQTMRVYQKAIA